MHVNNIHWNMSFPTQRGTAGKHQQTSDAPEGANAFERGPRKATRMIMVISSDLPKLSNSESWRLIVNLGFPFIIYKDYLPLQVVPGFWQPQTDMI